MVAEPAAHYYAGCAGDTATPTTTTPSTSSFLESWHVIATIATLLLSTVGLLLSLRMEAGEPGRHTFVPAWDGNPAFWKRYKDEIRIWLLAERTDTVSYSLAARMIQRLTGAARRVALSMPDEELKPDAGYKDGDKEVPADHAAAVKRLLAKLEATLTPEQSVRRGATMQEFFSTRKFYRIFGERVTEFSVRFDEGINALKDDGIDTSALEPVLGWFFLNMVRLTPERKERITS